ncbi:MAG: aldo/keto reductase [bacterium]|jgi:aryl-alcohol dehydrogenase-like predicted oxidoreductase|nr:aldo/keto reductase [candidate division KSB1 bacterium]MDH7560870.1 aldo/keto reductase [bacterium]
MEYVKLGRSGLKVSRICLGTMNFGPYAHERESFAIMDKAFELGINFFDTANVYGWKLGEGVTEQMIGSWCAQRPGRRDQIVLATKVFGKMGEGPNDGRLSAYHICRACEDSLRRLRTDRIDLYQMHHVDPETPWEEIWQAMEQLLQAGKVLYVGSSNFAAWHIVYANAVAAQRHLFGIVSEQSKYNLTVRAIELEMIPMCRALGVGLLPWSPLAGGLLAGVLNESVEGRRAKDDIKKALGKYRVRVERYEAFCAQRGEPPAAVALAWLLHNPAVTSPIIGPRTVDQLASAMRALEIELSAADLAQLDEIWPGPGGPAPEAYAW